MDGKRMRIRKVNQPEFVLMEKCRTAINHARFVHRSWELDNIKNPCPQNSCTDNINPKVCNLIGIDAFFPGPPACDGNGRKKSNHQHESVGINRKAFV